MVWTPIDVGFTSKRVESHNQPDSKRVFIDNVQPNQNSIRLEK